MHGPQFWTGEPWTLNAASPPPSSHNCGPRVKLSASTNSTIGLQETCRSRGDVARLFPANQNKLRNQTLLTEHARKRHDAGPPSVERTSHCCCEREGWLWKVDHRHPCCGRLNEGWKRSCVHRS